MSEQQEHPEGAVAAQEPTQPVAEEPTTEAPAAAEQAPAVDPPPAAEAPAQAEPEAPTEPEAEAQPETPAEPEAQAQPETPAEPEAQAQPDPPAASGADEPVGPKIVGVAKERTLPVVKKRLQEKPKREPLPWPELRAAVAATRDELDVNELKELFRSFPEKLRTEVTENVRGFKKGARRPVSQHAAKQLARAAHTARRMKKNSHPSGEVAEALGQAMAAELIASLEPEKAAQVILPKRDLLEREARQAQRRARDEEDKRRDEQRRKRRDDARQSRQQTSFGGGFAGAKIQGLDQIAALFAEPEQEAVEPETPAAEPDAPVTPATTAENPEPQVEGEVGAETAAETPETGSAPQPDDAA
ncbi:hypothetical protein [Baekduia alba]|uniref:hypothetical protein n=1 Tax=Baekduia alba TaxID=2997333 RepID=UPI002340DD1E|nr:hypothetical protein [Baekduia alba]